MIDAISHIEVIRFLEVIISGIFTALFGVVVWLWNRVFEKVDSLEATFVDHDRLLVDKLSCFDNRIVRLELRMDILDRNQSQPSSQDHSRHNNR
jgi:hypothetical protein